ncbi:MAG: hypothetical protein A2992_07805 [Elusimicrobia bacterium RIFCSPLOWO2_01_FULL_59_12]|nr:MAG: hypothetical protein A2992_07805 [Elusimicrobia bacterium RIFCSPLOWO2_01_FULL_59_12]
MRRWIWIVPFFIAACQAPRTEGPPAIRFGRDACSRCGMIINEARFASGYMDPRGRSVAFDDLGEMLAAAKEKPEIAPRIYAGDFSAGGTWIPASKALFVRVPGYSTPMGSGIVAFSSDEAARSFAQAHPGSRTLPFESALQEYTRSERTHP